jgi:hypothetical protein
VNEVTVIERNLPVILPGNPCLWFLPLFGTREGRHEQLHDCGALAQMDILP